MSAKAQTTRGRMLGVLTRPGAQILFHDTPGRARGERKFNQIDERARARDGRGRGRARCCSSSPARRWEATEERIAALAPPIVLARTQVRPRPAGDPSPRPERFARVVEVSALTGQGLEALVDALIELLPGGSGALSRGHPHRREPALPRRGAGPRGRLRAVPRRGPVRGRGRGRGAGRRTDDAVRIRANLLVERESQKGIVLGRAARALKALGIEARKRLPSGSARRCT